MHKGGYYDVGWARIQAVTADHSSNCQCPAGHIYDGGAPIGFVIYTADRRTRIYHGGDTNVFSEMRIIEDLYSPTHLLLPIGGNFTMGPKEAAFAVSKFLRSAQVFIPMHYGTTPRLYGTFEELEKELPEWKKKYKRDDFKLVNPHTLLKPEMHPLPY